MMKQINIAYDALYNGKEPYKPPPSEGSEADKSGVSDYNEPCFTDDESDLEQEIHRQDSEEENVQTFEQEKKLPKILSYVVIIGIFFVFPPIGQIISVILFIIRYLIQLFDSEKVQINNGFVMISLFLNLMLFCNSNVDNMLFESQILIPFHSSRMRMIVMFEDFNDMLTVEELCYILRIGRNKAYDLLRSGRINAFRDGKLWMIPKEAVINYIRINSNHDSTRKLSGYRASSSQKSFI